MLTRTSEPTTKVGILNVVYVASASFSPLVVSTKLKASFGVVVLGNVGVVAFAVSEIVVLSVKYVGEVVNLGTVFSLLASCRETFCPLVALVSSREIVIDEDWFVNCSVISVRSGEDPVDLRTVLSFNRYVLV